MTDWTKEDTEALHALNARMFFDPPDAADCDRVDRAAAHIEALETRVAELEAERHDIAEQLKRAFQHAVFASEVIDGQSRNHSMTAIRQTLDAQMTRLGAALAGGGKPSTEARIATLEAERADLEARLAAK